LKFRLTISEFTFWINGSYWLWEYDSPLISSCISIYVSVCGTETRSLYLFPGWPWTHNPSCLHFPSSWDYGYAPSCKMYFQNINMLVRYRLYLRYKTLNLRKPVRRLLCIQWSSFEGLWVWITESTNIILALIVCPQ
jgi:hypothetical protein